LVPGIAWAEPVYLDCELTEGKKPPTLELKLDEDSGKVTHNYGDGSFIATGFFASDKVTYQTRKTMSRNTVMVNVYTIDRVTLDYSMVMRGEATTGPDKVFRRN